MERNVKENKEYLDFLIINNTMINDKAASSIRSAAKWHDFERIIDFRKQLNWYDSKSDNRVSSYSIFLSKLGTLYSMLDRGRKINIISKHLIELISNNKVDEIYVRYKFNSPEVLLLSAFPNAGIHVFEDGSGDYYSTFNEKMPSITNQGFSIKQKVSDLSLKLTSNSLQEIDVLYRRIKGMYELICNKDGYRKRILLKHCSNDFIIIKNNYINILSKIKKNHDGYIFMDRYVLLLASAYSAIEDWYGGVTPYCRGNFTIYDDMIHTEQVISQIEILYPNINIVIKTHPRSPSFLHDAYNRRFGDKMCHPDIDDAPVEILFNEENLAAVVGWNFSSALIYAKNIFNKKAYFVTPYHGWHKSSKLHICREVMFRLGIDELTIS